MNLEAQYNPKDTEARIYRLWAKSGAFGSSAEAKRPAYCIVIPPPNVTGILHMGHALNNTIQDVLIRYARMKHYEALWMPGTDHAGIATQNVVERSLASEGKTKDEIGREEFLKRLWSWTDAHGSTIIEQLKKLGASCDWEKCRFTMDKGYSRAVKEAFIRLYEKDLIYRGNYIINWCPRCMTALSDEEAPYKQIDGWLYYIRYPVTPKSGAKLKQDYIVVATTRPETMLGDVAIAINPKDTRYRWLKDAEVTLPVIERKLRVIEDTTVDAEFGTGVVKVTPAHDAADFVMAQKHNLESINIMNDDATCNANAGDFAGMDRFEARAALLEVLKEKNLIERKEPYSLNAGHCYRCHTIIEPRLSLQWFVRTKPLAKRAIDVVENDTIRFYPARWKKVYLNWMNNIRDWCISRQIWWGHRLPVYYCQNCLKKASNNNKKGVIVSKEPPKECPQCKSSEIIQDSDVLDTWFSSWLWPFATLGWPKDTKELKTFYPTDTLVTASEILFFWVARMIMAGLAFTNEVPFKNVVIHGTVRDEKGIKMSKSLGNIIDPLEVIDKFGADALRFSLMMLASTGSDVYLSDEKFHVGRNFANKIWNAARFLLNKTKEADISLTTLTMDNLDAIDAWILQELNKTIKEVDAALTNYRINDAAKSIYEFFWHAFCDWYIEISKLTFEERKAKVLFRCLIDSLTLLHPVMPYLTEHIYQLIKERMPLESDTLLMKKTAPELHTVSVDKNEIAAVETLMKTVTHIRTVKADLGVAPSKRIDAVFTVEGTLQKTVEENCEWLKRLAGLGAITFSSKSKRTLIRCGAISADLTVSDIDEKSFLAALTKKIEKLDTVLEKISRKINNKRFVENAASEIVEKERARHGILSKEIVRLKELKDALRQ